MNTHTTAVRKPRRLSLTNMSVKKVEELVGREPVKVTIRGSWIEMDFGNCTVSFKSWK